MKKLLLISDSPANKISYYHLMLLMASLPFDRFYSHLILISLALHTIIQLKKEKIKSIFSINNLIVSSAFFVTLIAALYTHFLPQAFTELTLRIPILLIPVLCSAGNLDINKYRQNLLLAFSMVCTLTTIYLYADAFYTIRYYNLPLSSIFLPAFTNHNFSQPIDMHATFFSFQLVIALVNLVILLFEKPLRTLKLLYIACCVILLCGMVQLSSKSILAILFIVLNIVIPYCLLKNKKRLKFMIAGWSIALIGFIGILSIRSFRERYIIALQSDFATAKPGEGTDSRLSRWRVVTKLIKEKPIAGYGSGSEIPLLQDAFFNAKLYDSYLQGLNAHNQYLSFSLKSGLWGLVIYILTLIYGFKIAINRKDVLFISFMLVIIIVSLSENMLDADKGVMFYAFFFAFFILPNVQKRDDSISDFKSDEYLASVATNPLTVTSY